MSSDTARHVSRWLLPLAAGYLALWAVWWGYRLTVGGGLETFGESVTLVTSGISGVDAARGEAVALQRREPAVVADKVRNRVGHRYLRRHGRGSIVPIGLECLLDDHIRCTTKSVFPSGSRKVNIGGTPG